MAVDQIRFSRPLFERVRAYLLQDTDERICFLFGSLVRGGETTTIVVQSLHAFAEECYERSSPTSAVLKADARNYIYHQFCRFPGGVLINCHSHPFARTGVCFSAVDDDDDQREAAFLYSSVPTIRAGEGVDESMLAVSMVFAHESIDARVLTPSVDGRFSPVPCLSIVGEPMETFVTTSGNEDEAAGDGADIYDRQIGTVGVQTHSHLQRARVGLVGAGGLGSILAEGLIRSGFRRLTLIDPDSIEATNLNRWVGGSTSDIGRAKVDVAANRLRRMMPYCEIKPVAEELLHPGALAALKDCDVIVGGLDNHFARYLLNRFAVQNVVPYIDAGTRIYRGDDGCAAFDSRLSLVLPGSSACMRCSQISYFDDRELAHSLYDSETRSLLEEGGYLQEVGEEAEPSVLALNMAASSFLLLELLNLFARWRPAVRSLSISWNSKEGIVGRGDSVNFPEMPASDCVTCSAYLAAGDSADLPRPATGPIRATAPVPASD